MNNKIIALLMATTLGFSFSANANNLLSYSRISKKHSKSYVSSGTLETHLQWFKVHNIKVKDLNENLKEVANNLNTNSISLVFEGGYSTFATNVEPLLKKYNYSALLLLNPFNVDGKDRITTEELNKLNAEKNITIGISPNPKFFHKYKTTTDIKKNLRDYKKKLNSILSSPNNSKIYFSLSTPFMNMDETLKSLNIVAISDNLGVLSKYNSFLNRRFIDKTNISLSKLKENVTVQPLPIKDVLPINSYISKKSDNPPNYGFTLTGELSAKKSKVHCFIPNYSKVKRHNMDGGRIELRFKKKIGKKRTVHVYCSLKHSGNVYSYTRTFFVGK